MRDNAPQRGGMPVLVGVLALLTAVAALSVDMYLPAMPRLASTFGVPAGAVQYSLSLFFVGQALGQLAYGPLSDRYGRKPILAFGLCIYLAATVACALATTVDGLIAARALQGIGAAAGPVITRAILRDRFQGAQAASVMSFVVMVMAAAPLVAPALGGLMLTVADWRAIFWVLCGYAVVCLAALALVLAESHPPERRVRDRGLTAQYVGYLALLGRLPIVLYLACGSLMFGALFTYVATSSFVYIREFGVAETLFGFYFGANVLALICGSFLNGRATPRFGYRRLLGVAVTNTVVCSLVLLTTTTTGLGGFWGVAVPLFFLLSTVGVAGANTVAGLLDLAPDTAGAASALFGVCQFSAGAAASWLAGALGGDAEAMAMVMSACAAGSLLAYLALLLRSPATSGAEY